MPLIYSMGITTKSRIKLPPSQKTATKRTAVSQANCRGDSLGYGTVKFVIDQTRYGYVPTLADMADNKREKSLRHTVSQRFL